jgi:hypothetical protein
MSTRAKRAGSGRDSGGSTDGVTPEQRRIAGIKARLAVLRARERAEGVALKHRAATKTRAAAERRRLTAEIAEAEIAEAEAELDAAVQAPVSGGRDPTAWLPDELIIEVLLVVPYAALWKGSCSLVCRRWRALAATRLVRARARALQVGRWEAYASKWIEPRWISHDPVFSLAVGPDGTVYCGGNGAISVLSGVNGSKVRTLEGHTRLVCCLAVAPDGTVYSGSYDNTVRVWSGADGAHLRTLAGHISGIWEVAIGPNGKVYSGSMDHTVRVWSEDDGAHLNTLIGHTMPVCNVACAPNGTVYSGSVNGTIRVWSGDDGAHLRTLVCHAPVATIACGPDGTMYSGSYDNLIRVWSGVDGAHLRTLRGHSTPLQSIVCTNDGKVFSGSHNEELFVWASAKESNRRLWTLEAGKDEANMDEDEYLEPVRLAVGPGGSVFSRTHFIDVYV